MRTLLAVLLCIAAAAGAARADVVIGVFSDNGTTCSFSGNNAGLVTAHVVVRSDGDGLYGVRFKAPIPDCFDAVFVGETLPEGMLSIGDSQTGISIAMPTCATLPTRVLDITYYSSGGTTPCCEFPLVADPVAGYLQAVDCNQVEIPMQSLTAYMNADSTCVCSQPATPPDPPVLVYPPDGATSISPDLALSWSCSDPQYLAVTCDLYFGTTPEPPLYATDLAGFGNFFTYALPHITPGTVHYWKVVVRNSGGVEATGPVWQFTTRPNDIPVVTLTSPNNGATGVSVTPVLKWTGTDSTPLTYDVYLGTDPLSLPVVASGLTVAQYSSPALAFLTTYHWRVVAHDVDGGEGTSATRSFTTRPENYPPTVPSNPSPQLNANFVPLVTALSWTCSDPDGQPLTYDLYLGNTTPPPLLASNVVPPYPLTAEPYTAYYWRVVARDVQGATTTGPLWAFTTRTNAPPSVPSFPSPASGAIKQPLNTTLSWTCADPDGQVLVYDVYFGTTSQPVLVAGNQATPSFDPGPQNFDTIYYWRIVARDPYGGQTSGPVWFYTIRAENESPVFVDATPADIAVGVPVNVTLQWTFTDPESQPLTYDVYFGNDIAPPLVADYIAEDSFQPGQLANLTRYYWRVVARDPAGNETSMPLRNFLVSGSAPFEPSNPSPPHNGSTNSTAPLLTWQGGDPDGSPLLYRVYLGPSGDPPALIGTTSAPYFQVVQPLAPATMYSWYVTSSDQNWTTQGPLWSFTVTDIPVPVAFALFRAVQDGNAVEVRWELAADEAMERFTLYRREQSGEPFALAQGRVEGANDSYRDTSVEPGATYSYELVVRASSGDEFRSPVATVSLANVELLLHQNVPNPFNPQTAIRYDLPTASHVNLAIFDLSGRRVRLLVDEDQAPGSREALWTGRDDSGQPVSSGVYFYVLEAGKQRLTRKLVLLK